MILNIPGTADEGQTFFAGWAWHCNFSIRYTQQNAMYLKRVIFPGLAASLAAFSPACTSSDQRSINDAITQRERDKGYVIYDTRVLKKTEEHNHVHVIFKTVNGDNKTVIDTVDLARTGDGELVPE
ncbi:hypothetical protein GA0116948_10766 [Chitinophaga costaii]|uniref:Uncharacterized protein n=1 Tax=Chitinophaga costaii TaxID=1335309 RepID=A0A1C4E3N4_9BACT|nr:hypothetical protein [Chitinophaga costaii]PUZ24343.1 hypothetical protein DCM91_13010 [Chitinophaga costaii]SCC38152.1 hypothetical protein GA0116948_10766 [Chitinophaga costaii]